MTFETELFSYFDNLKRQVTSTPLNLGGVRGSGGGIGGPPGGYLGVLPQSRVAYDTTEGQSLYVPPSGLFPPSGAHLVHNLNRIRHRIGILESGGGSSTTLQEDDIFIANASIINFEGGATLLDEGGGKVTVTISGGLGGGGGEDLAATLALGNITGVNDIDISDGQQLSFLVTGDADTNLFDIGVTGTPTMSWVETDNALDWNANVAMQGLNVSHGTVGIILGADNGGVTRTNATEKTAILGAKHFTNATQPLGMVYGKTASLSNDLWIGGGHSAIVAPTSIYFNTAATSSITVGTERMRINNTGNVNIANLLEVDIINEDTASAGVTVDGLLIKDAGIPEAAVTAHEAAIDHDALANFTSTEHFTMLDEDDLSTDSATQAATQQSIKAYVDALGVGGGGSGVILQEDDVEVANPALTLNFEGAGVTTLDEGAGKATITIAGGGGSLTSTDAVYSKWDVDAPPVTASAYDDEFDDASFDTGLWTEFDEEAQLAITESEGHAVLTSDFSSGGHMAGFYQSIPAGDFTVIAKVSVMGISVASNPFIGFALWEDATSSTGDMANFWYDTNQRLYVQTWSQYDTFSSNELISNVEGRLTAVYLRMRRNGTTYDYDYSSDGVGWVRVYTGTVSFTPAEFGFAVNNDNAQTGVARVEFFRYLDSDVGETAILEGQLVSQGSIGAASVVDHVYNEFPTGNDPTVPTTSGFNGNNLYDTANVWESGTLRVYWNGLRQAKTYYRERYLNQEFLTTFEAQVGDEIFIDYDMVIPSGIGWGD